MREPGLREELSVVQVWFISVFSSHDTLKADAPSPPGTPTSRAEDHLAPPLVVVAETEPEPAGLSDGAPTSPLEGKGSARCWFSTAPVWGKPAAASLPLPLFEGGGVGRDLHWPKADNRGWIAADPWRDQSRRTERI